ncbi:MAG: VanZ family protein [Candidatus Omnitrophica bacterium]|nr:VanZ family protein [Candidatus Omnitrophota bacterium]
MKNVKLWLPVIIWCALIFFLSSIPDLGTGLGRWDFILRKIAHMAEYFILALLIYRALKGSSNLTGFSLIAWTFIFSFLYAVSDEVHQFFVYGRSCEARDVLIDAAGIIIFCLLVKFNKKFSEKILF